MGSTQLQVQEKPKKDKKMVVLLAVMVVIIVVLAGVVLWLVQQNSQLRTIIAESSTPVSDSTVNWKTYTTRHIGLSEPRLTGKLLIVVWKPSLM